MPFMQKQPPSIDAITWKHGYNTNLAISRHSWKVKTTTFHPRYLVSFCNVSSKYWVFIFSTYPKLFIKFESCIQDKCYKPCNKLIFFSRACLSKTVIISDMIDFIKVIFCSETTYVSTKQRLPVIFASF